MTFHERVRDLENRFRTLSERDGDVYLPNFTPAGPVDYVFIAMEPSLGAWASSPEGATAKIAAGFRNFMWSLEDFILHTSARQFLCEPGQTYHVTDISKGAMSVKRANLDRAARYKRWLGLLVQEIDLMAKPNAKVIPVGKAVAQNLRALGLACALDPILHYSGQAGRARRAAVAWSPTDASRPIPRARRGARRRCASLRCRSVGPARSAHEEAVMCAVPSGSWGGSWGGRRPSTEVTSRRRGPRAGRPPPEGVHVDYPRSEVIATLGVSMAY